MSDEQSPIFKFAGNDPDMVRASRQARESFRIFWREVSWESRRIIPALGMAAVKVAFSDSPDAEDSSGQVEHMWVNDVNFDGTLIHGTLINSPNWLKSVKNGDEVHVPLDRIGDWMYSFEDKAYGAFTVNVLRSRMDRVERTGHDRAWGLDFGDPQQPRFVPPKYSTRERAAF
jgi:uncharacterized protein YegJ (DUF2314 family)